MTKKKAATIGSVVKIENDQPVAEGKSVTSRGFRIDKFVDRYGHACSLQKSSLATEDAVWFGIDDPMPQIMSSDAVKLGRVDLLTPGEPVVGWVPWTLPDEVQISTRMHLTQAQVKALLPALQHFVKTGQLP